VDFDGAAGREVVGCEVAGCEVASCEALVFAGLRGLLVPGGVELAIEVGTCAFGAGAAEQAANTHTPATTIGIRIGGKPARQLRLADSRARYPDASSFEEGEVHVRPGGQPNMQQLMKQAQKMQQQLAAAQAELAETEVDGSAGGGLVTAKVTGSGELLAVTISPDAVDPDDIETLQDLVVAAVRDATRNAGELASAKLGPLTGGMGGLGIPGL
jgi:DNA-binding YbaB/EbfC family protein